MMHQGFGGGGGGGPGNYRKRTKPTGLRGDGSDDDDHFNGGKPKNARFESKEQSKERFARENHSEIERRRRNKMNAYINELSDMVPSCNGLIRKPDKLTILKMAVSYMKSLKGDPSAPEGSFKPTFLSDQELKHLVLEAADGFLFAVDCSSGNILYVSDSVTPVLNQSQNEWINKSFYDVIHPEDINKIKDQLNTEVSNDTRILDLKTGNVRTDGNSPANSLANGSRRNFIVRMKCGNYEGDCEDVDAHLMEIKNRCKEKRISYKDEAYSVVHCTGYIRDANQLHDTEDEMMQQIQSDKGDLGGGELCLVAIGRLQPTSMPTSKDLIESAPATEFITRQTLDGRFSFVDQRVTEILGYRPIDLLGKLCYEFYSENDVDHMKESFEQVLKLKGQPLSIRYHFKHMNGELVAMRSSCYSFQNPYTDEAEYIVCTNNLIKSKTESQYNVSSSGMDSIDGGSGLNFNNTSNNANTSGASGELDVTSIIQEKPGMYAYPYRVQPNDTGKSQQGVSILESQLGTESTTPPSRNINKRKASTSSTIRSQQQLQAGSSVTSTSPQSNLGKYANNSGVSSNNGNDQYMQDMYQQSEASDVLANMARKHQHEEPPAPNSYSSSSDWNTAMQQQSRYNYPPNMNTQQMGGESNTPVDPLQGMYQSSVPPRNSRDLISNAQQNSRDLLQPNSMQNSRDLISNAPPDMAARGYMNNYNDQRLFAQSGAGGNDMGGNPQMQQQSGNRMNPNYPQSYSSGGEFPYQ
ncbi:aryl hydrocarbon receptor nuclear translocator homolog isoform X2 [Clytia hemisphaerica]|uniref:aryl hydrocarbon receptor nuclear translocator homolog isoform X2 n=1 Tax=Clytia hemisphaerica TaxID=252671 RepID=UPI0034D3A10F|eukprot:TCONS_00058201-protein